MVWHGTGWIRMVRAWTRTSDVALGRTCYCTDSECGLGLGLGLAAKRRAKREETFQGKESVRCEKKKGGIERWRSENPEKVFGDIDMVSTLPRFCLCTFLLPRDRSGGVRERSTGRKKHMALAFASRCSPTHPPFFLALASASFVSLSFLWSFSRPGR